MALAREEGQHSAEAVRVRANGSSATKGKNGKTSTHTGMRVAEKGKASTIWHTVILNKRSSESGRAAKEGKDESECARRVKGRTEEKGNSSLLHSRLVVQVAV